MGTGLLRSDPVQSVGPLPTGGRTAPGRVPLRGRIGDRETGEDWTPGPRASPKPKLTREGHPKPRSKPKL